MADTIEHPLARKLRLAAERGRAFLLTRERRVVVTAIIIFVLTFTGLGAWKLWSFGYNALDLAIYNQVAWNSVRGDFFTFSIHPHSYLGDHLELFFAVLFPVYAAFQSPLSLIALQAIALAVAVIPLLRIVEKFVGKPWHLLFGLAYLGNPILHNMALYEFHILPFAIPLVSFALLGYVERKFGMFLAWSLLALTVREDVSLVVVGLGLLALLDRRRWHWVVIPILLGGGWLVVSLKISAILSGYDQYKFLIYYGWLGDSLPEIAKNFILKPWLVAGHLFTFSNLAFVAALLLPFGFLPLFRPRWFLPIAPTLLQLLLVVSAGELLVEIHYPAVLLPFLVVATAAAFQEILRRPSTTSVLSRLGQERAMAVIIYVVVIIYGIVVVGPLAKAVPVIVSTKTISDRVDLERSLTESLRGRPVVAGFEGLTPLSRQPSVYSLHYVLLGKKQFSEERYMLPDDTEVVLLDLRDFLIYQLIYEHQELKNSAGYAKVAAMLQERDFHPTFFLDRFAVFERGSSASLPELWTNDTPIGLKGDTVVESDLTFIGWSSPSGSLTTSATDIGGRSLTTIPFSLTFQKTGSSDDILQLEVRLKQGQRTAHTTLLPLGGGYHPSSDWVSLETVTSRFNLLVPGTLKRGAYDIEIRVMDLKGDVVLNALRSLVLRYSTYRSVGPTIKLGQVEVASR